MEVNTRKVWPVDYRGAVVGAPMGCPDCGCRRAEKSEPVGKTGMDRRTCAHCGRVYQEKKQEEATVSFRMCKYCGKRIVEAYGKWGRPMESGVYCSRYCAEAVHGFDNHIVGERQRGMVSFNAEMHDRACPQTRTHAEIMMDTEEGDDDDGAVSGGVVVDAMEKARKIDKRLPDILMGIANGETQEQAAKRWGMSQKNVSILLKKLRTSL